MNIVTALRPRATPGGMPPAQRGAAPPEGEGTFWCAAVGSSLRVVAELAPHLDTLSASIGHLPECSAITRPAVSAWLEGIKLLAGSWHERTRPALHELASALAAIAGGFSHGSAPQAGAVSPALVRRMASAVTLLGKLSKDFEQGLSGMLRASGELDANTIALGERLQADQVHALLLSQQASTLQAKLDDATMRQHAYWLLGPHAEQIRQEIAMHNSAREGVRRQLDHLRAEQAAIQAEARYLQHLLPSLASYLAGLDRFGAALHAALGASRTLLGQWRALPSDEACTADQAAAAPHWQALAGTLAGLRRPGRSAGVRKPGGFRT